MSNGTARLGGLQSEPNGATFLITVILLVRRETAESARNFASIALLYDNGSRLAQNVL